MGNKYQREVQNFSDILVTSPLFFNTFSLHKENAILFTYLLCLELNWLNILRKLRPAARLPALNHWTEATLLDVWHGMEQGVIDSAIDEWRRRIQAYVRAKGEHFEQKMLKCQ